MWQSPRCGCKDLQVATRTGERYRSVWEVSVWFTNEFKFRCFRDEIQMVHPSIEKDSRVVETLYKQTMKLVLVGFSFPFSLLFLSYSQCKSHRCSWSGSCFVLILLMPTLSTYCLVFGCHIWVTNVTTTLHCPLHYNMSYHNVLRSQHANIS